MGSRIFKAIWTVAVVVFFASLIFILGVAYQYFTALQKRQLRTETELAAQGVILSGAEYFKNLESDHYRLTWIDTNGEVLYDNEADSNKMESHLEREEVKEALETGFGEADRYSATLAEKQLYAARHLPDGTVIRLSIVQAAVWTLVLGFAQPILLVLIIALILSGILASRLAKRIVQPINEIDLNHPEQYYNNDRYKEVEPLLRHISTQKHQIKLDQEKIEQTALIRQEFTANVSHELKTPLQTISGYAELLENGMVDEANIKPFAQNIRKESLRMTNLVEDIIELTKLDKDSVDQPFENCDLYQIAENAVDSLESVAMEKNVSLILKGVPAQMSGIPKMLYSIVYNLCDNAIKYNKDGGSVRISVSQNQYYTILQVADTGIGIPAESQERIFERFYRVDKSHSKEVGGTGLGLSIVKHAVRIHRGKIEVQSKSGEGAEFTVLLPNSPRIAHP